MPYVKKERRLEWFDCQDGFGPETPGELNYLFTKLIKLYMRGKAEYGTKPLTYQTVNDILGALEGAKAEFYRRVVVPYEDQKILENGDVY